MSDLTVSACVELLFAEAGPHIPDRIRAAAAAGCESVEFWTWRDRPLAPIAEAVSETGVGVSLVAVEPMGSLTDPGGRDAFLASLEASAEAATAIGCRSLVVASGARLPGVSNAAHDAAIVTALQAAAPIVCAYGLSLLLEPLNTRLDHPGTYLSGTGLGLELVERVDRPEVGLLYDVYHSVMMGERPAEVLVGRGALVGHVHVADTDGRHEPGTGTVDWPETIAAVREAGYCGPIGLEYSPTVESAVSVCQARAALAS